MSTYYLIFKNVKSGKISILFFIITLNLKNFFLVYLIENNSNTFFELG